MDARAAVIGAQERERIMKRLRGICLALPETTSVRATAARFLLLREDAPPLGAQDMLVRSDPEQFFVMPYVGYRVRTGRGSKAARSAMTEPPRRGPALAMF